MLYPVQTREITDRRTMDVTFVPVTTAEDQKKLAAMAYEIWNEYWPSRIGQDQVDYMVANFQSLEAIERDMAEHGYDYWFLRVTEDDEEGGEGRKERIVGYTGGQDEPETNRYFISKIYLLAEERGRGFASKTIRFYEDLCRERGFHAMYLTVNKYNELGIRAYEGKGFATIDAVVTDIGGGFVMDDFIMEKPVS